MPDYDATISVVFNTNFYTVTFNFDNGTSPETRVLPFNASVVYPSAPLKDGYTFNGWDRIINFMPAENITITARWTEKPVELVEIVFSVKDMKEDEIKEAIEKYVPAGEEFTIERFEKDEKTGGTKVIIRFVDKDTATSYIETVSPSSDSTRTIINTVGFAGEAFSFSSPLCLFTFLCLTF